jgi:hypothetical protein
MSALKGALGAGRLGNRLLIPGKGKEIIFFSKASGPVLIQWVPLTVGQGQKRSQREAGYSPVSTVELHSNPCAMSGHSTRFAHVAGAGRTSCQ